MGNETEIEYNPRTSIGYIQFLPLQNTLVSSNREKKKRSLSQY